MKKKDDLSKSYAINVLRDLLQKDRYITELVKERKYSAPILQNTLEDFEDSGLVSTYTERLVKVGNARIMYSLTPKGREVGKKLEEINDIMSGKKKEITLDEEYQLLKSHFLTHVNAIENVVRIQDGPRITDVYIREIHGKIKLHCDLCDSDSCIHANFAYSLPEVRELLEKYK